MTQCLSITFLLSWHTSGGADSITRAPERPFGFVQSPIQASEIPISLQQVSLYIFLEDSVKTIEEKRFQCMPYFESSI